MQKNVCENKRPCWESLIINIQIVDGCKVRLSWPNASVNQGNITGYKILYYPNGTPNSREYFPQLINTTYATLNLSANVNYKFEIIAYTDGSFSNPESSPTIDYSPGNCSAASTPPTTIPDYSTTTTSSTTTTVQFNYNILQLQQLYLIQLQQLYLIQLQQFFNYNNCT